VILDPSKHSVVSEHIKNHTFDREKAKRLDTESFFHKRIISEMIHIKEQKNGINCKKDTEMLDLISTYCTNLPKLSFKHNTMSEHI